MRAVIYARYSSEQQRATSIDDQVRLCKEKIAREGWTLVQVYRDAAISGATTLPRGYQAMMEGAREAEFDIVVSEALDRLSRDQEDIAALFKRLQFADIKLVTLGEGDIGLLHIGLKGTMNALFLKDLADKTRRGLRGRVEAGKSGGGNPTATISSEATAPTARRTRRTDGQPGRSRDRARDLFSLRRRRLATQDRLRPQRPTYSRATRRRLEREHVERQSRSRDRPAQQRDVYRASRLEPAELRQGPGDRQAALARKRKRRRHRRRGAAACDRGEGVLGRREGAPGGLGNGGAKKRPIEPGDAPPIPFWSKQRPRYVFSGLMRCGVCGGGFSKISAAHFGCSAARNKGETVCGNRMTVRRDALEATVMEGLRSRLMDPALFKVFAEEFAAELNRLQSEASANLSRLRSERERICRQIDRSGRRPG